MTLRTGNPEVNFRRGYSKASSSKKIKNLNSCCSTGSSA